MTRLHMTTRMLPIVVLLGSISILPAQEPKKAQVAPLPKELVFDLGNGVKLEMIRIPRGIFRMLQDQDSAQRGKKITMRNDFYLGKYEITREQWNALLKTDAILNEKNKLPIEISKLDDCKNFLIKLNSKVDGKLGTFRLPTEVEWEYASRAGLKAKFSFGDSGINRDEYEWNTRNSEGMPHVVGTKKPNQFGLYDMYGNVWECCHLRDSNSRTSNEEDLELRGGGYKDFPNTKSQTTDIVRIFGLPILNFKTKVIDAGVGFRVAYIPSREQLEFLEGQEGMFVSKELTFKIGNGEELTTVLLPENLTTMGYRDDENVRINYHFSGHVGNRIENEGPPRDVTVIKGLSMGKYEVTRGQFRQFVESEKYQTEAELDSEGGLGWEEVTKQFKKDKKYTWKNPGFEQGDDHPVVNVSWNDAVKFCEWLSKKHGRQFRLPTEAEWEYACRADSETRFSCGDREEELAIFANIADESARKKFPRWNDVIYAKDGFVFTAPVGRFKPNQYGLHDMHGNVWEWCQDWFGKYETDAMQEPLVPMTGTYKVFRGGSWSSSPVLCRAAFRGYRIPSERSNSLGFRVVLEPDAK
jgi:formylglycine-generating enzyme required for sulfatase activity